MSTFVSGGTRADQLLALLHARAAVQTRFDCTGMERLLAVESRVLRRTDAGVAALAGVVARPAVLTRAVVGAVVEVLVAEQAAPALLADAVPGLGAGAVEASRMSLALVAELAHPARMTTGMKEKHSSVKNT